MKTIEILSLPRISFAHAFKAATYRNRFAPRERFLEVTYIAEGCSSFQRDKQLIHAKEGDVFCFFHDKETSVLAEQYHCHHTVGAIMEWAPVTDGNSGLLLPLITPAEHNTTAIVHLIDIFIHKHYIYKDNTSLGSAKFLELLCAIDECNRKNEQEQISGSQLYAQRAKKYIQKNLHTPLTQQSVAEYLGISAGYLCYVFKETEGISVMRYINTIKLESIKALMENENVHLYEAAPLYGYNDPNYVSRLFKQYFGYNITDKPHLHSPL